MATILCNYSIQTWVSALTGAVAVSLVGILPLFIVPNEQSKSKFINIFCFNFEYLNRR
jgi:hypothetical protein